MPQQDKPIRIAQAGEQPHAEGAHAEQGHGEHEYKLGDIPPAGLLASNALIVVVLLIGMAIWFKGKLKSIPDKYQNFGEWIVERMTDFTRGIIGPGGEKYVPFVGTLFFFILVGNLLGLIPGFHSPTANVSTTLALGLIVFVYVQYTGIRSNGIGGYLAHFAGPIKFLAPLIFPLELISELARPFTLAMRLFGNIFGEDTVIIVLATLGAGMFIPLHIPMLPLALLTAFVQAFVFSLLTCIYISLVSHHDSEHEGHGHSPGHGHAGIEQVGMVP